jgi:isoleucyl-tRNA synthetase
MEAKDFTIQQLFEEHNISEIDESKLRLFEKHFGYQIFPAIKMLKGKNIVTLPNLELLINNRNEERATAETLIYLHEANIVHELNGQIKYIWAISEFLRFLKNNSPSLITSSNFKFIFENAAILNDEKVWSTIYSYFPNKIKLNQNRFDTLMSIFNETTSLVVLREEVTAYLNSLLPNNNNDSSNGRYIFKNNVAEDDEASTSQNSYDTSIVDITVKEREEALVLKWHDMDVFHRGIKRFGGEKFVTYDGPPFATGLPHHGHLLAMSIKDAISSYQALNGRDVETRFGWDCHGVPVEHQVEKKYELSGHQAIKERGIAWFNEECRSIVLECAQEWYRDTKRLGRFINMDNDYKTMDLHYMESVWHVFKTLHEKGLIYQDLKVVAYSPALGTALSDFEAKLNYKDVSDPAITMQFPLMNDPNTCLLVWTTTPWSVPANVAVAVNRTLEYVKVTDTTTNLNYIVAKELFANCFDAARDDLIVKSYSINELIGQRYLPMFDSLPEDIGKIQISNCYLIVHSDHVTNDAGSGCVHICPAYGEDDFRIGKQYDLPIVDFIDENGRFKGFNDRSLDSNDIVKGEFFKDADSHIQQCIRHKGRMFRESVIAHSYPFCWRTETPLMYRATPSIYLEVTAIKDKMIENNKKVNWHPDFAGHNRFHNWLVNARDWAISRTRYWGNPIPMWVNVENQSDTIIIGSKKELEDLSGHKITDLHRHHIDQITIIKDGKQYKRIEEVFDCWFESGSMPYAQVHYPFEHGEKNEFQQQFFPAQFVAEGIDQTRGWFYVLSVLGNALFDRPPFENVIVNGILLGNDNKKMSKSKGNFPAISHVFDQYGADSIRLMLLGSPAVRAQEVAVTDEAIQKIQRKVIITILNVFRFFAESANTHAIYFNKYSDISIVDKENKFDRWLIYLTESFKLKVKTAFDGYDLVTVSNNILLYVHLLSTWYVRNVRERVKKKSEAIEVLSTMHYALDSFCRYAAAIIPFISDSIFSAMYGKNKSVHLEVLSPIIPIEQFKNDYETMEIFRKIAYLCFALRETKEIRLRQPLRRIYLDQFLEKDLSDYIEMLKETVNVKEIEWVSSEQSMLEISIELNFKVLGPKFRGAVSEIKENVANINYILKDNILIVGGYELDSGQGDFKVVYKPKETHCSKREGNIWVTLDVELTTELVKEGYIRDFQREVQQQRKALKCKPNDKIILNVTGQLVALIQDDIEEIKSRTNSIIMLNPTKKEILNWHNVELSKHYSGTIAIEISENVSLRALRAMGGAAVQTVKVSNLSVDEGEKEKEKETRISL